MKKISKTLIGLFIMTIMIGCTTKTNKENNSLTIEEIEELFEANKGNEALQLLWEHMDKVDSVIISSTNVEGYVHNDYYIKNKKDQTGDKPFDVYQPYSYEKREYDTIKCGEETMPQFLKDKGMTVEEYCNSEMGGDVSTNERLVTVYSNTIHINGKKYVSEEDGKSYIEESDGAFSPKPSDYYFADCHLVDNYVITKEEDGYLLNVQLKGKDESCSYQPDSSSIEYSIKLDKNCYITSLVTFTYDYTGAYEEDIVTFSNINNAEFDFEQFKYKEK